MGLESPEVESAKRRHDRYCGQELVSVEIGIKVIILTTSCCLEEGNC